PLVCQVGVLDNTWHHVALVYSAQSEALYLDGILQGMSQPQYHQTNKNLTGRTTIVLKLDRTPIPGQMISGTIAQVNPAGDKTFGPGTSQIYRFQGWLPSDAAGTTLNLTKTSTSSAVKDPITYRPASGSTPASLTFTLNSIINSANALTIDVSYLTAD